MELSRIDFVGRLAAAVIDIILLSVLLIGCVGFVSVYLSRQGLFHPDDFQQYIQNQSQGIYGFAAMTRSLIYIHITFGAVSLGYHFIEVLLAASPGKLIMGMRVRDEEGGQAPLSQLLLRFLAKQSGVLLFFIGSFMSSLAILIFVFIANVTVFLGWFRAAGFERQALHDKFALTALYSNDAILEFDQIQLARAMEDEKTKRPTSSNRDPGSPDPNRELVKW